MIVYAVTETSSSLDRARTWAELEQPAAARCPLLRRLP